MRKVMTSKTVINVPNYPKVFSYIDKGIPLYYFALYELNEVTNRLQAVDALSYGLKLYKKVTDPETAISWIENDGMIKSRADNLRTKEQVLEYLENDIDLFMEV